MNFAQKACYCVWDKCSSATERRVADRASGVISPENRMAVFMPHYEFNALRPGKAIGRNGWMDFHYCPRRSQKVSRFKAVIVGDRVP